MLQAAEVVCMKLPGDNENGLRLEQLSILDRLAALVDKSMIQTSETEEGEIWLTMLETIREYGWECLQQSGEAEVAQHSHALYYLSFAEKAELHLQAAQQGHWRRRLQQEQGNLRAALNYLLEQQEAELAVRLSGTMWLFWYMRGNFREGRNFLERALKLPSVLTCTEERARALCGAGACAFREGNYTMAIAFLEESVACSRQLNSLSRLALSLMFLALVYSYQHVDVATHLLEQSIRLSREGGDGWLRGWVLDSAARIAWKRGDAQAARIFLEESEACAKQIQGNWALASSRQLLATIALAQGEYEHAASLAQELLTVTRQVGDTSQLFDALFILGECELRLGSEQEAYVHYQQSFALAQETGDQANVSRALVRLGDIAQHRGEYSAACANYRSCLAHARAFDEQQTTGKALIGLAHIALTKEQYQRAANLFAAAEARLDAMTEMDPLERSELARGVAETRMHLGEQAYLKARAEGRNLSLEQMHMLVEKIDASKIISPSTSHAIQAGEASTKTTYPRKLTSREVEVLRLVAQGLTNEQIAKRLVISYRTVTTHLNSIYTKLGVNSRSAATRFAVEHHLT